MKKSIAIVLSLVLMFAFTAVTFAADKEAATAEKKSAAAEKKAAAAETKAAAAETKSAAAAKKAAKKQQVTGEVTAVDAKANTLTVKGKKGDVVVSTDDKTMIMAGKEKKAIADIKAGDKVTVSYTEADGKNVAVKVAVKAAPAKKEKAAPAEKKAAPAEKKEAPAAAPAEKKAAPAKKAAGY